MVCKNCGRRTYKGEKFCPKCGSPMPERPSLEEEINVNSRFNRFDTPNQTQPDYSNPAPVSERPPYAPAPAEQPGSNPAEPPQPAQEVPPSVFVPEIEYKPVPAPTVDPSANGSLHSASNASNDENGFYGSYGAICNSSIPQSAPGANNAGLSNEPDFTPVYSTSVNTGLSSEPDFTPVFSTDAAVAADAPNDYFNAGRSENEVEPSIPKDEDEPFNPMPIDDDDDDLVLPVINDYPDDDPNQKKKSMGYEATTKIENANSSARKGKPLYEAIPDSFKEMVAPPKVIKPEAIASGTVTGRNDLPKLKEGQMYVALTHKQLRRLRSRSFRGLGIICTLCLVIISAFCIWNYANSFSDPLVGRWKGDLESQDVPIESLKQMGDVFSSTWEFSDSGTLYVNLVINDTPVSLSGSYAKQNDEKGEQYLLITLKNPMDNMDYSFNMYYTITGKVLELNDMEGLGMSIDLVRE